MEEAPRTSDERKLDSSLLEILRLSEQADTSSEKAQRLMDLISHSRELARDPQGRIRISINLRSLNDMQEVTALVRSMGGEVEREGRVPYIMCKIQPKCLRGLIADSHVFSIEKSLPGFTRDHE